MRSTSTRAAHARTRAFAERALTAAFAVAALALPACSDEIDLLTGPADPVDAGPPDLAAVGDGPPRSTDALLPSDLADAAPACAPVRLGPNGTCGATLAASLLRYALCGCNALSPAGVVDTSSFDSSGGGGPAQTGAALGSNGYIALGDFSVGGPLVTPGQLAVNGSGTIAESLHAGLDVGVESGLAVGGDAWVGGSLSGPIVITGTLYVPPGQAIGQTSAGNVVQKSVSVDAPCECNSGPRIQPLVAAAGSKNDNASIGLAYDALSGPTTPARLDLPCGQFYLDGIRTASDFVLAVHGQTALFVDGDVLAMGRFDVALDPGAELDLVATGGLGVMGGRFGDLQRPAGVRVWLDGGGRSHAMGDATIACALFAPNLFFDADQGLDLRGAFLVNGVGVSGNRLSLTFDRAVLSEGSRVCGTASAQPVE